MENMRNALMMGHTHKKDKKKKKINCLGRSRIITQESIFLKGEIMEVIKSEEIIMYSRKDSEDCSKAKAFFRE